MGKAEFKDVVSQLARYCAYQDRFEIEVIEKLKTYELTPEFSDQVLNYLKEEKYVDQKRTLQSYVRGKILNKKWGKRKVHAKLKMMHVKDADIFEALQLIDDEDYRAILKKKIAEKMTKNSKFSGYQLRAKVFQSMLMEGFETEWINEVLDDYLGKVR